MIPTCRDELESKEHHKVYVRGLILEWSVPSCCGFWKMSHAIPWVPCLVDREKAEFQRSNFKG